MDFSVFLIGVLTISILVLPFFIAAYSNKNRKKRHANNFFTKSRSIGLNITEHDVLYDAVIGVDPDKEILFYFNTNNDITEQVDLKRVFKSTVKQYTRTVGAKKDAYTVTDKIELELLLNSTLNNVVKLKFYDNEIIFQQNGELQIAEKWQKITQPQTNAIIEHLNISQSLSGRMAV